MARFHYGLVIAGVLLASCQLAFQSPLRIVSSSPAPGRYSEDSDLAAWIEFSAAVPRGRAEKGILLKENGSTMEVRYDWSGRRVNVTPVAGFSPGHRYDLNAAATIETEDGLNLAREFSVIFYTRPDDTRPTARIADPLPGAVSRNRFQPVVLQFSRPVDRASFYSAVSCSPSFRAAYVWGAEDRSCVMTPLEALKAPLTYTVRVAASLSDTIGNTLGGEVVSWFSEGAVDTGPSVEAVVRTVSGVPDPSYQLVPAEASGSLSAQTGFESRWGLRIRFDRPVDRAGLDSNITVEPAWGFSLPYEQPAVQTIDLIPAEPFVYGTTYTLTVRRGVADTDGNLSSGDQIYRFKVDGPSSSPPRLQSIAFSTNLPSPAVDVIQGDHSTDYTALDAEGFGNVGTATALVLTFETARGAVLDLASLMTHFSVTATDSNTTMTVTALSRPVVLDAARQSVRADVLFTRGGSGLLVFRLSAGFADSLRNATLSDEVWPVLE